MYLHIHINKHVLNTNIHKVYIYICIYKSHTYKIYAYILMINTEKHEQEYYIVSFYLNFFMMKLYFALKMF